MCQFPGRRVREWTPGRFLKEVNRPAGEEHFKSTPEELIKIFRSQSEIPGWYHLYSGGYFMNFPPKKISMIVFKNAGSLCPKKIFFGMFGHRNFNELTAQHAHSQVLWVSIGWLGALYGWIFSYPTVFLMKFPKKISEWYILVLKIPCGVFRVVNSHFQIVDPITHIQFWEWQPISGIRKKFTHSCFHLFLYSSFFFSQRFFHKRKGIWFDFWIPMHRFHRKVHPRQNKIGLLLPLRKN